MLYRLRRHYTITRKSYMFTKVDEQKQMIEKVILKCYEISRSKKHEGLKVHLVGQQTLISVIKENLKLLKLIDSNSETYRSLVDVSRRALTELQSGELTYHYKYLLEYFCKIPFAKILSKKSSGTREAGNEPKNKKFYSQEADVIPPNTRKEVHIAKEITGKKLTKINKSIDEAKGYDL